MAYDMEEDLRLSKHGSNAPIGHWDEHANSPLPGIVAGVAQYNSLGVPTPQLLVAVPWCKFTSNPFRPIINPTTQ
jgi:hypothetical protein